MDCYLKTQTKKSFLTFTKGAVKAFFLLTPLPLLFVACQSTDKKSNISKEPAAASGVSTLGRRTDKYGMQLTIQGENFSGNLAPDASRILYVSRHRTSHKHQQIYELNLSTLEEKRITYQDGQCLDPAYTADGRGLVYSSTTDEIKEKPKLFYKTEDPHFLPAEIYSSDISGINIDRITFDPDADRYPKLMDPILNRWSFMSRRDGKFEIWQVRPNVGSPSPLLYPKESNIHLSAYSFPLEVWAWLEEDIGSKTFFLKTAKRNFVQVHEHQIPLTKINSMAWASSSQALILAGTNEKQGSEILAYYYLRNCVDRLLTSENRLSDVDISRDESQLLFSRETNNNWQIYLKEINLAAGECASSQTQDSKSSPADRAPR